MTILYVAYLIATVCFVLGIKQLGSPATARQGNVISSLGMLIGVVATLFDTGIIELPLILGGILFGCLVGIVAARFVAMTAMPEMVALLNGFGGGSSLLLAIGAYLVLPMLSIPLAVITFFSIIIGGLTLTGSFVAWAKLAGHCPTRPMSLPAQPLFLSLLVISIVGAVGLFCVGYMPVYMVLFVVVASLILGVLSVLAIGGGDMPVVIALLNSYSGIAAAAAGLVVGNVLLVVAGLLVGASGLILTTIMCKAMNRSLNHVLFGGFGGVVQKKGEAKDQGKVNPIVADDAFFVLEAARNVVIVPGYGMAVAQAQHVVKELADLLQQNGCMVRYAIHPVAGRMPGHMNVLLAEANVDYDQLCEMDAVNPTIDRVDVCLVIGANDVVNPAALDDQSSPIYGMPIIEVTKAKTVFVLKRSMNPGFSGIQNSLFFSDNTRMLFGDAKQSIQALIAEFKD